MRKMHIPPYKDWVKYPDMDCPKSGLSCFELSELIFGHFRNFRSTHYNGYSIDVAYHMGLFDEGVFSMAFECAEEKLRGQVAREKWCFG